MPRFRNPVVSTANILDGSVTTPILADSAVTTVKIANLAVTTAKIDALAVTAAKIANATITDAQIDSLNANKITAGIITALRYRTAASGERLEIRGDTNDAFIRLFNSGGTQIGQIGTGFGGLGASGITIDAANGQLLVLAGDSLVVPSGVDVRAGGTQAPLTVRTTGATNRFQVAGSSDGIVITDGAVGAPAVRFFNDTNTGIYRATGDTLAVVTAGSEAMRWTNNAVQSTLIRDNTTGVAANTVTDSSSGVMRRSTSSIRYKTRVTTNVGYLADLEVIPSKHYRRDDHRWRYGLIAEWLAAQDPLLAESGPEGVEDYDTRAVLAVLAAKINRLEALAGLA